jgi:hypothetical protein
MRTLTDDSPLLSSVSKPMTFRPRQTSYLRIAPKMVLQLILYLEPADVDWMSVRPPSPPPPHFLLTSSSIFRARSSDACSLL